MASAIYNSYKDCAIEGRILFLSETMHCTLLDSTGVAALNIDSHTMWSDVLANEVAGTGYTANGAALASKTSTQDNTNDRGVMDAADVTWSASTITARGAIIMQWTTTTTTSELVCLIDFGSDKSSSSSDFTITWNSAGILYLA